MSGMDVHNQEFENLDLEGTVRGSITWIPAGIKSKKPKKVLGTSAILDQQENLKAWENEAPVKKDESDEAVNLNVFGIAERGKLPPTPLFGNYIF